MVDRRVLKYKRRFFHSRKRSAIDNVAMQKDCTILRPIATFVLETGLYFVSDYVQLQFIYLKTNVTIGSNLMK